MVCGASALNRNSPDITELTPVCFEGRVIYAAPFDPAMEPTSAHETASHAPAAAVTREGVTNSSDTRIFFFGIAAGVLAAVALGHQSDSH